MATSFCASAGAQELNVRRPHVIDGYGIVDFALAENGDIWLIEKSKTDRKLPAVLVKIDSSGKQKEYKEGITAPPGIGTHMLSIAPDGNVWFLEAGKIGRCSPTGKIDEFVLDSSDEIRIASIAVGPDGDLWFARTSLIGKIAANGVVTEYSVGISQPSFLWDIAAGLDGNIWFTDRKNRVGKITKNGSVSEFPIEDGYSVVGGAIVAGPDGNMWFSEQHENRIGKINPQGLITHFLVSRRVQGSAYGLAVGRNGDVWYTAPEIGVLGKIDIDGKVSEYPIKSAYFLNDDGVKEVLKLNKFHVTKIEFWLFRLFCG